MILALVREWGSGRGKGRKPIKGCVNEMVTTVDSWSSIPLGTSERLGGGVPCQSEGCVAFMYQLLMLIDYWIGYVYYWIYLLPTSSSPCGWTKHPLTARELPQVLAVATEEGI